MKRERKKVKPVKNSAENTAAVKAENKPENSTEKTPFVKTKGAKITFGVLAGVVALIAVAAIVLYPGKGIAKGISVNGINIGGMSIEEAESAIDKIDDVSDMQITIKDGAGNDYTFSASDAELSKDAKKTVEKAYKLGRDGGLANDTATLIKLLFSPVDIPYSFDYNDEKLTKILYDFGVSVLGEQKNYDMEFSEGQVVVRRGMPGQSEDVSELKSVFLDTLEKGEHTVLLTLKSVEAPEPSTESLYNEIFEEPKDASYSTADGKLVITPEVEGREVSKDEIAANIEALKNGEAITLKIAAVAPKVTEATINAELFGYTLGEFSTSYSTSSANRSSNVELAASKINGTIMMPNEVFSYNDVVGQRTAAHGFKSAPVFENGETVQGMGGGVCQVSSTLYCAVLYADLQVLERQNHSLVVSYVPKGQDATVAYGSIDFKFKNNNEKPIKIVATTAGKILKISIMGAKPAVEKKVEIVNSVYETRGPSVEEVPDATLSAGTRKVISNGKTGYSVSTVRKVFENGKEVKSEKMPVSKYKMVPTKVAVGSAAVPAAANTPPAETPANSSYGTPESKPADTLPDTSTWSDTPKQETPSEPVQKPSEPTPAPSEPTPAPSESAPAPSEPAPSAPSESAPVGGIE